jgi:hypothetical protein
VPRSASPRCEDRSTLMRRAVPTVPPAAEGPDAPAEVLRIIFPLGLLGSDREVFEGR